MFLKAAFGVLGLLRSGSVHFRVEGLGASRGPCSCFSAHSRLFPREFPRSHSSTPLNRCEVSPGVLWRPPQQSKPITTTICVLASVCEFRGPMSHEQQLSKDEEEEEVNPALHP